MAKIFRIKGEQRLTQTGKIGAWLFVLSPIASGIFYYWFLVQAAKAYNGQPGIPLALLVISGMTFLGGAIMVLVGRSFSYYAQEDDPAAATKGLWS